MSKIKKVKKAKLSQEIIQPVQVEYNQIEQVVQFEKRIYDLEQLLDIAQSFCQNLDFDNLLESIVYICMAQMHVLGAEIFVRDLLLNEQLILETSRNLFPNEEKLSLPINSPVTSKLLESPSPALSLQSGFCFHGKLRKFCRLQSIFRREGCRG